MNIELEPGKYVVAVSGGVDSVVLLDLLSERSGTALMVAHFDHGIRPDAAADRRFVEALAAKYGLPFEYGEGRLGPNASEAEAREARYKFLNEVMQKHQARAIITAHHQDDMLETAIINLLRGTGRKGLSALGSRPHIERPLLRLSKRQIQAYAHAKKLEWREDPSNRQEIYLRNYIRHQILPRFGEADLHKLQEIIGQTKSVNEELDALLAGELRAHCQDGKLQRSWFNQLPHDIALETMATWLRDRGVRDFDRRTLQRLVVAAKTGRPSQRFDVVKGAEMTIQKDDLALALPER